MTRCIVTKVLVTGGSGFIGREIVQTLLKKGFEVNVLDIFNVDVPGITFFQGSVLDQEIISKAMSNCEYVIHMAAILGVSKSSYAPVECLDVNVLGTRNVLKCCVIHGIKKMVFPSSSEVYGEPVRVPVTEDTVLQPKSEYGVSKSVCEEYIKAYKKQHNLDFTIVRYFNVYGERQANSWVMPKFVNNAILDKPLNIFGDGSQVRAFCHVSDAAAATVTALMHENAKNNTFNIGNSKEPITMKELARKAVKAAGTSSSLEFVPLEESDRSAQREIFNRVPSTEKAKQLLGFEANISVDEGIRRMLAHKREHLGNLKREVEETENIQKAMKNGK